MNTIRQDWKNLEDAFLEWHKEYAEVKESRTKNDSAGVLMETLGIPDDEVDVLIGGSNAPIFKRAADEIRSLRAMVESLKKGESNG